MIALATSAGRIVSVKLDLRPHDRHVAARQESRMRRYEDGVAAKLHAVRGGAEHGRADALARRQQGIGKDLRLDFPPERGAESVAEIAEVPGLAAVDIFARHRRPS